jgi:hypothetical protein
MNKLNKIQQQAIRIEIEEYRKNEKKDFYKFNFFRFNIWYAILIIVSFITSIIFILLR